MSKPFAIMAEYETPAEIMAAAKKVHDEGYQKWDVHSPFPIHGMDDIMGLDNANVGWFTFVGGLTGLTLGMAMIYFMNKFKYYSSSSPRIYVVAIFSCFVFSPVF